MKVRLPIAGAFFAATLFSGWLGFSRASFPHDKLVHFIVFFVLSILFYWSMDTSRKRAVNATLLVCTIIGSIGSEFAQDSFTDRVFDYRDIAANFVGSIFATALSSWYHGRLVERRRKARYDRLRTNLNADSEAQLDSERAPVELATLPPEAEASHSSPAPA